MFDVKESAVRDELMVEGSPMESHHNRGFQTWPAFVLEGVGSLIWLGGNIFKRRNLLLSAPDAHHNKVLAFVYISSCEVVDVSQAKYFQKFFNIQNMFLFKIAFS